MKSAPDDLGYVGAFVPTQPDFFAAWPETPAAPPHEQGVLPVDGTIQAAYEAWRATPDGVLVYAHIRCAALLLAEAGQRRLGVKDLWERARRDLRRKQNNDFTALCARELVRDEPILRGLLKMRERRST